MAFERFERDPVDRLLEDALFAFIDAGICPRCGGQIKDQLSDGAPYGLCVVCERIETMQDGRYFAGLRGRVGVALSALRRYWVRWRYVRATTASGQRNAA